MSDEESRSMGKRMWKITSGVFIVFFLRIALKRPYIEQLINLVRSVIFREISDLRLNVLISLSLGQYIKASVWDFPVMTSLSVNK